MINIILEEDFTCDLNLQKTTQTTQKQKIRP